MNELSKRPFRIGCGAGFSADRLPPALDLLAHGQLDAMIVECVGERTLAFGHRDRMANPDLGYNAYLARRMTAMLPLLAEHSVQLITNMGVANPLAAGRETCRIAKELEISGCKIAVLLGDDITERLPPSATLWEGGRLEQLGAKTIGANAYLGAEHILPALDADIVITGRVADPSMCVAPLMRHFGWGLEDWDALAAGTLAGHLIECGMQVTGGYFADPGFKEVPNLADCGYPIAEVGGDLSVRIDKLPQAGGAVTPATVKEQLIYEVHDPSTYLTPDVSADFSQLDIEASDDGAVCLRGIRGRERPQQLKATIGVDGGWLAEAGVSYAGPGAGKRACLARDILKTRLKDLDIELRMDVIGLDALHQTAHGKSQASDHLGDARLRVAARSEDREPLETVLWETESLLCSGPAAGGGFRRSVTPSINTYSTSIDRSEVQTRIEWFET